MKEIIYSLFPTPVYRSNIDLKFNNKQKKIIEDAYQSNFLDNRMFKDIKNMFEKHINIFLTEGLLIDKQVKPFITESWIEKIGITQACFDAQDHCNSYLTGIYLYQCDSTDQTFFMRYGYEQLRIRNKATNSFNCASYYLNNKQGELYLFPSNVIHTQSERKTPAADKISIHFNVFVDNFLQRKTPGLQYV